MSDRKNQVKYLAVSYPTMLEPWGTLQIYYRKVGRKTQKQGSKSLSED